MARKTKGLLLMILSCVFFAVMANLAYLAQTLEPQISTLSLSSSRIMINLIGIMMIVRFQAPTSTDPQSNWWRELWGTYDLSLWLRGLFGAIAMIFYFSALRAIGAGESTFLQSSNSIFIALLAPLLLKQKNSLLVWISLCGAGLGLFLLLEPRVSDLTPLGRIYGIFSGLFSAMAYLMIAKAGKKNRPESVVFYFCLVGTLIHLGLVAFIPTEWPKELFTWILLLGIGIFGTVAQIYLTEAYQLAPAALAGAVAYTQPVLNTLAGALFFNHSLDLKAWIGASLIGGFGVVLPFMIKRSSEDLSKA